ncbi:MAG: redoxin domain-containing protein [Deltaproteobacteria bacterium]|nr:redoxin domain-containing protein [Deltaproteobacteria bacterium]
MKSRIRSLVISIIVISFLSVAMPFFCFASDPASAANIFVYPRPHKVADLVLKSPSGQTVSLKDFRGKVVILHFWSINCPACRMEEPFLEQLKRSFGPSGLEILAVNLVDSPQAIASHAVSNRLSFPILVDGGQGFQLKVVNMAGKSTAFVVNSSHEAILEVPGFPTTYIVDCRGSAVGYSVGCARWDSTYALNLIQKLVAEAKTCGLGQSPNEGQPKIAVANLKPHTFVFP